MTPPMVAFGFDGVLVDTSMLDELAAEAGDATMARPVNTPTNGLGLDDRADLQARVGRLEGLPLDAVTRAFDRLELRDGTADTIATLRSAGVSVAVITDAFRRGVERALAAEGVRADMVVANELVVGGGQLTGAVRGQLVDASSEAALIRCATQVGAELEATVAVGHGPIDVPMLRAAGTAIGIDASQAAATACDHEVDRLTAVLPLVGIAR